MPTPAKINELVPLLFVEDITKSAAFYVDKLGFTMTRNWEPNGKLAWCRIQRGNSAFMLQQAEAEDAPAAGRGHGVDFYLSCDDVHALHAELVFRGLACNPPQLAHYGDNQIRLRDPDGYRLCFNSAAKKS